MLFFQYLKYLKSNRKQELEEQYNKKKGLLGLSKPFNWIIYQKS